MGGTRDWLEVGVCGVRAGVGMVLYRSTGPSLAIIKFVGCEMS